MGGAGQDLFCHGTILRLPNLISDARFFDHDALAAALEFGLSDLQSRVALGGHNGFRAVLILGVNFNLSIAFARIGHGRQRRRESIGSIGESVMRAPQKKNRERGSNYAAHVNLRFSLGVVSKKYEKR